MNNHDEQEKKNRKKKMKEYWSRGARRIKWKGKTVGGEREKGGREKKK